MRKQIALLGVGLGIVIALLVSATALASEVAVTWPSGLDDMGLDEGLSKSIEIHVYNKGEEEINVSFESSGLEGVIEALPDNRTIPPDDMGAFFIEFRPTEVGEFSGTVLMNYSQEQGETDQTGGVLSGMSEIDIGGVVVEEVEDNVQENQDNTGGDDTGAEQGQVTTPDNEVVDNIGGETEPSVALTINVNPPIGGVVAGTVSDNHTVGDEITLTAVPNKGFNFESWTGRVVSRHQTVQFTIKENTQITANFTREEAGEDNKLITLSHNGATIIIYGELSSELNVFLEDNVIFPVDNLVRVSPVYDIDDYDNRAEITLQYDENKIPENVEEEELNIYRLEDNEWTKIGGVVTEENNDINASVNHLSKYAVFSPKQVELVGIGTGDDGGMSGLIIGGILLASLFVCGYMYLRMGREEEEENEEGDGGIPNKKVAGILAVILLFSLSSITFADTTGGEAEIGNDPPIITNISLSDYRFRADRTVTVRITAKDNNGAGDFDNICTLAYYRNGSKILVNEISNHSDNGIVREWTTTFSPELSGDYGIKAKVEDNYGLKDNLTSYNLFEVLDEADSSRPEESGNEGTGFPIAPVILPAVGGIAVILIVNNMRGNELIE